MGMTEYTDSRAQALNKLNIPEMELPIHIKILWFDNLTGRDISHRICLEKHSHTFFELHFVLDGKMCYECDGETMELCSNQAVLIPPNSAHRYVSCDKDLLKAAIAFSLSGNGAALMASDLERVEKFDFSEDITENVNFILRQSEKKDFLAPGIISGRILEIIYSVCAILQIRLPESDDKEADPRVLVAKEYIDNNKHRIINCEDVAKECCLSVKQLNRVFKNDTGSSVFEYIVNVRTKYAKKLLLQSEYSIKEISLMMGFENECSFVLFFKRHCGMPPGSFRKQNLGMEE